MKFIYEQIETGGVSKVNILTHRFFYARMARVMFGWFSL